MLSCPQAVSPQPTFPLVLLLSMMQYSLQCSLDHLCPFPAHEEQQRARCCASPAQQAQKHPCTSSTPQHTSQTQPCASCCEGHWWHSSQNQHKQLAGSLQMQNLYIWAGPGPAFAVIAVAQQLMCTGSPKALQRNLLFPAGSSAG